MILKSNLKIFLTFLYKTFCFGLERYKTFTTIILKMAINTIFYKVCFGLSVKLKSMLCIKTDEFYFCGNGQCVNAGELQ